MNDRNDPVTVPCELSALLSLLPVRRHLTLSQYRPGSAPLTGFSQVAQCRVSLRHLKFRLLFVQDQVAAGVHRRMASRAGEGTRPSRGGVLTPMRRDQAVPRRGRDSEESAKGADGLP
jgi:hypothetical protein